MLGDRTKQRLVELKSLLEDPGCEAEQVASKIEREMGSKEIVDALQHPLHALKVLTGGKYELEEGRLESDMQKLVAACGGDADLAQDMLASCGKDVSKALQVFSSSSSSCSSSSSSWNAMSIDLTSTTAPSSKDPIETIAEKCGGDRNLAKGIWETAGQNLELALSFFEQNK